MEKATVKIAGISFAVNDNPDLALARPDGTVTFVPEPENKFDKDALRVEWEGTKIGYIPQYKTGLDGKPEKDGDGNKIKNVVRERLFSHLVEHGSFPHAVVKDYSYKPAGTNDFNHDHVGILASILIEIDMAESSDEKSSGEDDKNFSHYEKDGRKYERASTILDMIDPDGSRGIDGSLTRWMIDTFPTYAEYRSFMAEKAADGTDKHDAVEGACKAGLIDAVSKADIEEAVKSLSDEEFNRVPTGFWNFVSKECAGLKLLGTEDSVFDDTILVAGTYDALFEGNGKKILVDWKSAKQVSLEHIIKTCFYAKLVGADEAWVVALGSKNKSGYQLKKVGRVSIENGYQIMKQAALAKYFVEDLKQSIKGGV